MVPYITDSLQFPDGASKLLNRVQNIMMCPRSTDEGDRDQDILKRVRDETEFIYNLMGNFKNIHFFQNILLKK